MAIEIVDLPIKNGGSFHSYVSFNQRVMLPRIFPFQAAAAAQSPGLPSTGFSKRSSSKVGHPVTRSGKFGETMVTLSAKDGRNHGDMMRI